MSLRDDTTTGTHDYKVVQKLIAMRPVFEIYDEQTGQKIAVARQTFTSVFRATINFEDNYGKKILTVKGGFFNKTFRLYDDSGEAIAWITRPWIALRKNFTIYYKNNVIKAQGGVMAWGFEARNMNGAFAFMLNKKILAIRDQFRVTVGPDIDWLPAVAFAVIVDRVFFRDDS